MRRQWLLVVFATVVSSLTFLWAGSAFADTPINLTDVGSEVTGDSSATIYGPAPLGGFTVYTDRTTFTTDNPGLPFENFDSAGCAAIAGFPAPLNSSTTNACYAAGDILPGLELRDNPLNDSDGGGSPNGLVFVPGGQFSLPDSFVGSNTFTNTFEVYFTPTVAAAGLDVASITTAAPMRVRFYNGATLITEYNFASLGGTGGFIGLTDSGGISRVELLANNGAAGNGAEGLTGILFGGTSGDASITLDKTVGTSSGTCATTDTITVPATTTVYYCYTVENTGEITLTRHDLTDTELGTILTNFPFTLVPGASAFLTQSATITQTTVNIAVWTAYIPGGPSASATDVATVTVEPPTAVTVSDLSATSGTLPLLAFAASGLLLLAAAGVILRKR